MLTGLFWGAVDSFAGLFNGFYYMFTGESTSKADKFDNLRSMKILNTLLAQKSHGIRIKVGLGIFRTNVDSEWNPVYNAFHRNFCCGNEMIRG